MTVRKLHADELDIDAGLAERLVADQFPESSGLPLRLVEPSGTEYVIYRLGSELSMRLPRHERTVVSLEKELDWLPRLAPQLQLAVPVPVARGEPAGGFPCPWAVYPWLAGEDATSGRIADTNEAASALAQFISELQSIDAAEAPEPGRHNAFRGAQLTVRDDPVRASIDALRDTVDATIVTALWDEALAAPGWTHPPLWIHGDLDARNLLVEGGRVSAVIDFGCLGAGDPACDVAVAWKLFSGKSREIFRSALDVDDATWTRARGWVLSQALIALPYYTLETNPVLVLEARRWLDEVLAEAE